MDWDPEPCGEPELLAFSIFEEIFSDMRRNLPTYRWFNLQKIERKALSTLRKNNSIIIYPSDKNLEPSVIQLPMYLEQCLNEHRLNKNNYKHLQDGEDSLLLAWKQENLIDFYHTHADQLDKEYETYFEQAIKNLETDGARIPVLYGTWKVYKQ